MMCIVPVQARCGVHLWPAFIDPSSLREHGSDRRGFTLLEIVIVMIIVGIVGAVVVPALFRQGSGALTTSAEPVLEVLRSARQAAADSGRNVRLTIDPQSGRYMAELTGASSPIGEGTFEGVSIGADSARVSITFEPTGVAFGDSMVVSGGGQSLIVSVNQWTGVPRAYRW